MEVNFVVKLICSTLGVQISLETHTFSIHIELYFKALGLDTVGTEATVIVEILAMLSSVFYVD